MCNAKHEPLVGLVGGPPVHHGRVVKRRVIEEVVYHPLKTRSHGWLVVGKRVHSVEQLETVERNYGSESL